MLHALLLSQLWSCRAPGRVREVRIAGVKRTVVVFTLLSIGIFLLWRTHALLHLAVATIIGVASLYTASQMTYHPFKGSVRQSLLLSTKKLTCCTGDGAVLLHAVFRAPNLKARMASARHEFRAAWRGYQTDLSHDYTL